MNKMVKSGCVLIKQFLESKYLDMNYLPDLFINEHILLTNLKLLMNL